MNESDVRERLHEVITALGLPMLAGPTIAGDESLTGADTQRIATTQIDDLLRRVATLTGVLGTRGQDWDHVDRLAAQLLLTDLTVIASTTRALNDLAAKRLTGAVADLVAARHDAERSMQEAS